jgi:hypothetical protein
LRGDASTGCDAPVKPEQVLGKVVCLERDQRIIDPYGLRVRLWSMFYLWLARLKRSVSQWFSSRSGPRALGTKGNNSERGTRNTLIQPTE